jgi:hypothetical protein
LAVEWGCASDHDENDDTHGPHVCGLQHLALEC